MSISMTWANYALIVSMDVFIYYAANAHIFLKQFNISTFFH